MNLTAYFVCVFNYRIIVLLLYSVLRENIKSRLFKGEEFSQAKHYFTYSYYS